MAEVDDPFARVFPEHTCVRLMTVTLEDTWLVSFDRFWPVRFASTATFGWHEMAGPVVRAAVIGAAARSVQEKALWTYADQTPEPECYWQEDARTTSRYQPLPVDFSDAQD